MGTKDIDNLNEFNTATGLFTAKNTGWHLVNVRVTLSSTYSEMTAFFRALKDGLIEYRLDLRPNTAATAAEISASGSVMIYCVAGTTIAPQILTTLNSTLASGAANTRMEIIRLS